MGGVFELAFLRTEKCSLPPSVMFAFQKCTNCIFPTPSFILWIIFVLCIISHIPSFAILVRWESELFGSTSHYLDQYHIKSTKCLDCHLFVHEGTWGRSTWTMPCWSTATSSSSTSLSSLGEISKVLWVKMHQSGVQQTFTSLLDILAWRHFWNLGPL